MLWVYGKETSERSEAEPLWDSQGVICDSRVCQSRPLHTYTNMLLTGVRVCVCVLRFVFAALSLYSGHSPSCEVFKWSSAEASPQHLQSIPHPALASVHPFTASSGHSKSKGFGLFIFCQTFSFASATSKENLPITSPPHHSLRGAGRQEWLCGLLLEA